MTVYSISVADLRPDGRYVHRFRVTLPQGICEQEAKQEAAAIRSAFPAHEITLSRWEESGSYLAF